MDKHLEFEEVVDYIACDELSSNSVVLAQKVNSHILVCEKCRKMYTAIHEFYDFAFNNSLDNDIFNSFENLKMLIKFKVDEKINIIIDRLAPAIYRYDYPMVIGARDANSSKTSSYNVVVDEDNRLNTICVDKEKCFIELDKEDWGEGAPVILVVDNDNNIVFSGTMIEQEDVFQIQLPLMQSEYKIYISVDGE